MDTNRYVLVNHSSPDFDSIVSTWLWLKANGLTVDDKNVRLKFVSPGGKYKTNDKEETVVHIDTGNAYDAASYFFDHHQDRSKWPAAASTLIDTFSQLGQDPLVREIVITAERVDSAGEVHGEDEETLFWRRDFNEKLRPLNRGPEKIIVITEQKGPWEIVELIANLELEIGEINDADKLVTGIIMLDRWYEQKRAGTWNELTLDSEFNVEHFDKLAAMFLMLRYGITKATPKDFMEIMAEFQSLKAKGAATITESVIKELPVAAGASYAVREIAELVWLMKTKRVLHAESEMTTRMRARIAEDIEKFNEGRECKLLPITVRRGPWSVAKLLPGPKTSRIGQVLFGLNEVQAWYNKKTAVQRVRLLLQAAKTLNSNGLTFLQLPDTEFTAKALRYHLRRLERDKETGAADVFTAAYFSRQNPAWPRIGVTVISSVSNMTILREKLRALDPKAKLFLSEPSHFVLYLERTKLTVDEVLAQAISILRPALKKLPDEVETFI